MSDDVEGAGVAGVAGLLSLADELLLAESELLGAVALLIDEELSCVPVDFDEEYPSLNHPPPLNCTEGAVITRSSLPPQCGQATISGSENFCIFSVCRLHCVHSYS